MNKLKNILFRADSSSTIGTGHIMRDLVLAKQYPKANITFATQELDGNINHKILEDGYKLKILNSNNLEELNKLIKKLDIDMLVCDHYSINYTFEKALKIQNPTLKIMVLDDTYEKHYCDILLNHNISGDKKRYKGLVPKHCELRCGAKHTLLRDEFIKEKKKLQKKKFKIHEISQERGQNSKFKIFLAMGGADSKQINIKVLEEIKILNLNIEIVTTSANEALFELKQYVSEYKNINLHVDSTSIAVIMQSCDIAIVTPSVIVNEIIFMKIPFISIMVTENQLDMYHYLLKKGMLCLTRENLKPLTQKIKLLKSMKVYNSNIDIISNIISQRKN